MEEKLSVLNIFQRELFSYLNDFQPQMLEDEEELKKIILARSEMANDAYLVSIKNNIPYIEAMGEARAVLMDGLEFSPVSFIKEVYEETKGEILDNASALAIYHKSKQLFDECSGEFEDANEELDLKAKLAIYFY